MSTRHPQRGFTLVEMLISLAIIGFMMLIAWSSIIQTTRAKKHYEGVQDRYREVRVALGRLEKDLSMAYLSSNQSTLSPEPMVFFVGERLLSLTVTFRGLRVHELIMPFLCSSSSTARCTRKLASGPQPSSKRSPGAMNSSDVRPMRPLLRTRSTGPASNG